MTAKITCNKRKIIHKFIKKGMSSRFSMSTRAHLICEDTYDIHEVICYIIVIKSTCRSKISKIKPSVYYTCNKV